MAVNPWENDQCWTIKEAQSLELVVPLILTSSYIYYLHPTKKSIATDAVFDNAMQTLKHNYDKIEHQHKHLITKEHLDSGSLFNLSDDDYPGIVKNVALGMSTGQPPY